jgi:GNAT superfamily N-acetyltransferase
VTVTTAGTLDCRPATAERWPDLVGLFGERGACGGCWCMWWRKSRSEFARDKDERNRQDLQALVTDGPPPGLLGYLANLPVAWLALGPRSAYPVAARSRIARLPDGGGNGTEAIRDTIWLISCLFVHREYRRRGIATAMISNAVAYAAAEGASAVDAVPVESTSALPDAFAWTGLPSSYRASGFVEIARPGPRRPLLRLELTRFDGEVR